VGWVSDHRPRPACAQDLGYCLIPRSPAVGKAGGFSQPWQCADENVQPLALFYGLDQSAFFGADSSERVLESGPPLPRRFPPLLDELHGSVDGRFQDGGIERGGDGVEDRPFEGLLGHVQVVSAHGGPRLLL